MSDTPTNERPENPNLTFDRITDDPVLTMLTVQREIHREIATAKVLQECTFGIALFVAVWVSFAALRSRIELVGQVLLIVGALQVIAMFLKRWAERKKE